MNHRHDAKRLPSETPQPLAVSPRVASRLLSLGNTRIYELIRDGELESYIDGRRARRITTASIKHYIARQLHAQTNGDGGRRYASSPHPRGSPYPRDKRRKRKVKTAQQQPELQL
jgi:excisionase family DNA binding protein